MESTSSIVMKQLRRVRTLGRGASGAVVWLASDDVSGELLAVKSAPAACAAQLRREGRVLDGLRSPHIVPCLGAQVAAGGEYRLFLEFAPGGSLADEAARSGGRLAERDIRAFAGDVARGLAYLHGLSLVHGDVKPRNVVIGADGSARLTDFGCARPAAESTRPIGGTPAFMAPEVARGEEQGPAADVWALGCTVVEMATGRAPWSEMTDVLAAVHRIGYTDAVPEVPTWLSKEAKHFLAQCFVRDPSDRYTAAQLLEHPFLAATVGECKPSLERPSPKTTLDDAFWDSDTDDEADEVSASPAVRIAALATSALPDWDSDDEGWIDLMQLDHSKAADATPLATTKPAAADEIFWAEISDQDLERFSAADIVTGLCPSSFFVQNRASDGASEQFAATAGANNGHHILCNTVVAEALVGESEQFTVAAGIVDHLLRVAGAVTLSHNGCLPECTIQRSCGHGEIHHTPVSQCICNRNRVKLKQIVDFEQISSSCVHPSRAFGSCCYHWTIDEDDADVSSYQFSFQPLEIEHVHGRQATPFSPSLG